jgi:quinol monooxygenase YgiN
MRVIRPNLSTTYDLAMIIETALFKLNPGQGDAFMERAADGVKIFQQAVGCLGMEIRRSAEDPDTYMMFVKWATLENHIVDFKNSEGVKQWRAMIADLLAAPTQISNWNTAFPGF